MTKETNELPEDAKQQIDQQLEILMQDDNESIDHIHGYKEGAEFGYRLGLQSREEELDKLALELSETIIEKDELFDIAEAWKKENERLMLFRTEAFLKVTELEEQLKARDKEIEILGVESDVAFKKVSVLREQLKAKDKEIDLLNKSYYLTKSEVDQVYSERGRYQEQIESLRKEITLKDGIISDHAESILELRKENEELIQLVNTNTEEVNKIWEGNFEVLEHNHKVDMEDKQNLLDRMAEALADVKLIDSECRAIETSIFSGEFLDKIDSLLTEYNQTKKA